MFRFLIIAVIFLYQFASTQSETRFSVNYIGSTGTPQVAGSTQGFCYTSSSEIVFSFSVEGGEPSINDWLGVFESDDCDHADMGTCKEEFHNYDGVYLRQAKQGNQSLKAPQPLVTEGPVTYRGYYFSDDSYTFLARSEPFQIETCPGAWTLKFSPKNDNLHRNCLTRAGDGLTTSFDYTIDKPHSTELTDWIGFYEVGRCIETTRNSTCPLENAHEEWAFLNGEKNSPKTGAGAQSGTTLVPIPTKKGVYKAYYFTNGGYHWVTETSPFAVECNRDAVYSLNYSHRSIVVVEGDSPSDTCKNSTLHFTWNIQGETSTLVDWVGIYPVDKCDQKAGTCPFGTSSWSFITNKRYWDLKSQNIGKNQGEVFMRAPEDFKDSGEYVAYFFVNDGYHFVAQTPPFVIKSDCLNHKSPGKGFGFAVGMGIFTAIALVIIAVVFLLKNYVFNNGTQVNPGHHYDQLNREEINDDSHEEYDNQISISSSSGDE